MDSWYYDAVSSFHVYKCQPKNYGDETDGTPAEHLRTAQNLLEPLS